LSAPDDTLDIDLSRFLALSPDLLALVRHGENKPLWLNDRWTDVLGWSLDQLRQGSFFDLLHPDDFDETVAAVQQARRASGPIVTWVGRMRHKDGSY